MAFGGAVAAGGSSGAEAGAGAGAGAAVDLEAGEMTGLASGWTGMPEDGSSGRFRGGMAG